MADSNNREDLALRSAHHCGGSGRGAARTISNAAWRWGTCGLVLRGRAFGRQTQLLHLTEARLERSGEVARNGSFARLEGRDADEDVVGMRIVAGSVAVWNNRAIAHECVHCCWNLNKVNNNHCTMYISSEFRKFPPEIELLSPNISLQIFTSLGLLNWGLL